MTGWDEVEWTNKTSIATVSDLYQLTVMPFGLCKAPIFLETHRMQADSTPIEVESFSLYLEAINRYY